MSLRLEDIELIRQLKYRYWRFLDTGNVEEMRALFTEDVSVDYEGGTYRWQIVGREKMLEAVAASFNANSMACHTGHHPEIEVLSETTARGTWYLTDIFINLLNLQRTTGSALYHDEYVKVDGQWKISTTHYIRLYEQIDTLPEKPNLTAHYLARVPAPDNGKTAQE